MVDSVQCFMNNILYLVLLNVKKDIYIGTMLPSAVMLQYSSRNIDLCCSASCLLLASTAGSRLLLLLLLLYLLRPRHKERDSCQRQAAMRDIHSNSLILLETKAGFPKQLH